MRNKKNIIYLLVFILFVFLVSFVANHHENWSDEAQAWLLARDSSTIELLTKYLRCEGHPIIWYLIIKIFILLKLPYESFNLISVIFSSLGVFIFLFKSRFEWYIKVLFPFTFFVFYQFSVISRAYCMILLILSILASIWEKRESHYLLFTILLIIMMNLEIYTYLLAGSIFLLELIDYIKDKKNRNKGKMIYFVIIFLSFFLTLLYLLPQTNTYVPINELVFRFSKAFILPYNLSDNISLIVDFFLISYLLIVLYKKNELFRIIIMILPVILFMIVYYFNVWHYGILFLFFIFIIWINKLENTKSIMVLIIISCIIQIRWSINSSINEVNKVYSSSNEVASFIKKYDYKNLYVFGYKFEAVAINAYFPKNIYRNWTLNKGFFSFDLKNKSYFNFDIKDIIYDINADIIVCEKKKDSHINNNLKNYDKYMFPNNYIFQTKKITTKNKYIVYVKKGLKTIS